jgi:hypothetical protein
MTPCSFPYSVNLQIVYWPRRLFFNKNLFARDLNTYTSVPESTKIVAVQPVHMQNTRCARGHVATSSGDGRWCSEKKKTFFYGCLLYFGSPSFHVLMCAWMEIMAYLEIFFGGGSTNSRDRGQREQGSGGVSPLVRGSAQFANVWNPYSY